MHVLSRHAPRYALIGLWACSASWEPVVETAMNDTSPNSEFNPCQNILDELGYPLVIQEDLEDPLDFTIHFAGEPLSRYCGGMVVELADSQVWDVGVIADGTQLELLIPASPPDQFQVVAWATQDVAEDPHDHADQQRLYWADIYTSADGATFGQDHWSRYNQPDEEGVLTAYLIRDQTITAP